MWKIEDDIRGKNPDIRAVFRQEQSKTIVARLFDPWEKRLGKVSGTSKNAEANPYARTQREALERFFTEARVEIDNNIVELAIRPQTITRKNSLFAKNARWTVPLRRVNRHSSPVGLNLQNNRIEPLAYLKATPSSIAAGHQQSRLDNLLSSNFISKPRSQVLRSERLSSLPQGNLQVYASRASNLGYQKIPLKRKSISLVLTKVL